MSSQPTFAFADGKEPEAFRTIGEVAQAFGLKQHVLRYWEEQFPMLKPLKRAGGRRYYRPEDVRLVAEISRLLYREGFTIRGARQALSVKNGPEPRAAPEAIDREAPDEAREGAPDSLGEQLRAVRDQLSSALRGS